MKAILRNGTGLVLGIVGGIKGLKRDGDVLPHVFSEVAAEAILITISPEEVNGILDFIKDPYRMTLSDYEMMYGVNLRKYGEVETPSPIYTESARLSSSYHVPLVPLDLPEEKFSRHFMNHVSTWQLVRHSVRKRRLMHQAFPQKTPEEFVEKWNSIVNSLKGLRKMEELRLDHIMKTLDEIILEGKYEKILLVTEYEFYRSLLDHLIATGFTEVSEESLEDNVDLRTAPPGGSD